MRRPKLPRTPVDGYTLTWWEIDDYLDKAVKVTLRYDDETQVWEMKGPKNAEDRYCGMWWHPETGMNWWQAFATRDEAIASETRKLQKQIEYLKKRIRRLNK